MCLNIPFKRVLLELKGDIRMFHVKLQFCLRDSRETVQQRRIEGSLRQDAKLCEIVAAIVLFCLP